MQAEQAREAREPEPTCADCGEPIELASPEEPDSWIHAAHANYFGDHTAWLEEDQPTPY